MLSHGRDEVTRYRGIHLSGAVADISRSTADDRLLDVALTDGRTLCARLPTDAPEGDGTLAWDATSLVLARARSGAATGLGYTTPRRPPRRGTTTGDNGSIRAHSSSGTIHGGC